MALELDKEPLIVRLLLAQGHLSGEDLERFRSTLAPGMAVDGVLLIRDGVVPEEVVARAYAEHLGISYLDRLPADEEILIDSFPGNEPRRIGRIEELTAAIQEAGVELPEQLAAERKIRPAYLSEGMLHVACLNPADFSTIEELRLSVGMPVVPHATTLRLYEDLGKALGQSDKVREIILESGEDADARAIEERDETVDVDLKRNLPTGKASQVLRIVNTILIQAVEEGASDIHLEPYEKTVRVRFRIDGHLREVTPPPRHLFSQVVSRLKILAKMDIAERRKPQDGGITMKDGDQRIDLRASTVPTVYGEKMVLRVLEKGNIPERMEDLGFSAEQARAFMEAGQSHHGLIFVTGPTGSGKSTTLYTCLNLINDPGRNIVTVEDPVEYKFEGLNQVPVRASAGMTFASALRAFLRQDPDVIMVGEVRDTETAQICMRAALTGHLVLSTLHTNSALQVVNRLIDMGVEPFLLGPALRLLEAQRLVRRLCTECKQRVELPADVAKRHGLDPDLELYGPSREPDCPKCRGLGYKGRVGLYEVVPIGEDLADLISHSASERDLRQAVRGLGIHLLDDTARLRLAEGVTSLEEVSDYIRVD
ncbi:MAG: type II/IV secretion system protein [Planctomycetota bacterium]|nr:MAG: type II/IV secretion system protein [Planctomycetota bacterium]